MSDQERAWVAPAMPEQVARHLTPEREAAWREFLVASKAAHEARERWYAAQDAYQSTQRRVMALETRYRMASNREDEKVRALWRGIPAR